MSRRGASKPKPKKPGSYPVPTPITPPASGRIFTGALINGSQYGTNPVTGALYSDSPWDSATSDLFESHSGKGMSIIHYGQPWQTSGVNQPFFTGPANLCYNNGSYPLIDWAPWNTGTGGGAGFSLTAITNGNWDSYIDSYATAINAWNKPIFIRPMWEENGTGWFPWQPGQTTGGNLVTSATFISAWRRIYSRVKSIAPKATFVWCPNVIRNQAGTVVYPISTYPGDAYVDWVGMDGYCGNAVGLFLSFTNLFQSTYDSIYTMASTSKPLMLGEWGCDNTASAPGGSKAAWITDALNVLVAGTAMPNIRAAVWFNRDLGTGENWRIETPSAAQTAYAAGLSNSRFASAEFGSATVGPITAPA